MLSNKNYSKKCFSIFRNFFRQNLYNLDVSKILVKIDKWKLARLMEIALARIATFNFVIFLLNNCSYVFFLCLQLIEEGKSLYIDDVIKIEPVEGEIWPNSSREITVIFKPLEARTYKRAAFCEITGREIRLPLRILGDGKGPELQFSIDSMDIGPIFIGSCHHYEIVLANKGEIEATYKVQTKESAFGTSFTFDPDEACIMPKSYQAIHITFKSTCLGDFDEVFYFSVEGLPDPLQVEFRLLSNLLWMHICLTCTACL